MIRTSNPALNEATFRDLHLAGAGERMTVNGAINKSLVLLGLLIATAALAWDIGSRAIALNNPGAAMPWILGGAIGGLIVAIVTVFKKEWSPVTAPLYAVLEGLAVGAVSAIYAALYKGIVPIAVMLTFGIALTMLLVYRSGLIRVTDKFRMGVVAATGGVFVLYMATWVLGMFGVGMPFIHESTPLGIGISVVIIVIASLNLILDFDLIATGAEQGAPKYMEWYASFGLLVTLVWLYFEILRLLAKLQRR